MSTIARRLAVAAAAALTTIALTACSGSAGGATGRFIPGGPVTMLVPFGAGGGSDASGRAIASGLEEITGSTITVENREGGSGAVGYSYFLGKRGNGNVLLPAETALLALPLTQDVQFDYTKFTPIMKLGDDYTLLVVPADAPYQTCPDVIDAVRQRDMFAGVSGATSHDEVIFRLIEQDQGVTFDRVPFESGGELIAALLGGQIQIANLSPSEVIGQLESGDLKALCATSEERYTDDRLKDVPTAKEQGIDVAFAQFRSVIAPGGISEEARTYWIDAARKYEQTPGYRAYIDENLMQPNVSYGDDFRAFLDDSNATLSEVLAR